MAQGPIFARKRGFTLVTVLLALVDLAGILAGAALWWVADAERHGENMPWVFGITLALALVALLAWAASAGRRREALALSTLLVIAAALIAMFG
jgi:cytochrome bd-type quinol oxidase subunit 2